MSSADLEPVQRRIPLLDAGAAYRELQAGLDAACQRVLASGWYLRGAELAAFESQFASFCGTSEAVGVGNGLDALTLALAAAGIGPGDEVVVPRSNLRCELAGSHPGGSHTCTGGRLRSIAHARPGGSAGGSRSAHGSDHAGSSLRTGGRHGRTAAVGP